MDQDIINKIQISNLHKAQLIEYIECSDRRIQELELLVDRLMHENDRLKNTYERCY